MSELKSLYDKFNSIINPENKKIYFLKEKGLRKNGVRDKIPIFYTLQEVWPYLSNPTEYHVGSDLSQTNYIFVDCDNKEDWEFIQNYLNQNNIKTIQTSSQEPDRGHFYFKKTDWVKAKKIERFNNTSIHDYYAPMRLSPHSPVLPSFQNKRQFIKIEEPDYLPEIFK